MLISSMRFSSARYARLSLRCTQELQQRRIDDMNKFIDAVMPGPSQRAKVGSNGKVQIPCVQLAREGDDLTAERVLMTRKHVQVDNAKTLTMSLAICKTVHKEAMDSA